LEMGFLAAQICMDARPMDSQQARFSLPAASVGPSLWSLDDDPRRLGALKRPPSANAQLNYERSVCSNTALHLSCMLAERASILLTQATRPAPDPE
jgi:hypothetical protein